MLDPELKRELDDVKNVVRSSASGGLILLMFFMSCVQCSKLNHIEDKVTRLERNQK